MSLESTPAENEPLSTGSTGARPRTSTSCRSSCCSRLFGAFPLVYTVWVSLFDWDFLAETHSWIGLDNYTRLFGDYTFWNAVLNTAQILVLADHAAAAPGVAAGVRAEPGGCARGRCGR